MAKATRATGDAIHEALQRLRQSRPDAHAAFEFLATWQLNSGHEAALAIQAATILEQALEGAIATHFAVNREDADSIFVDQSEGGISAFSMKIKLAYVLGVIEKKIRKELTLIKTIRNFFTHSPIDASFAMETLVAPCNHLFIWKELPLAGLGGLRPDTAKQKYAKSIEYTHAYLRGSVTSETERVPLSYEDSDFYLLAFLDQPPPTNRFARSS